MVVKNNKTTLSVFIPVYNAERFLNNICKINNYLKQTDYDYELIVVDDNSDDSTLSFMQKICSRYKHIKYVKFSVGPSRRENLGVAMRLFSTNSIVVFTDVDLSVDIDNIGRLISVIEDRYDISIGSRYEKGARVYRSVLRFCISKLYNFTLMLLFCSKINDHQCGFKAFKKDVLFLLLNEVGYDKNFNRGWFWDAEILITAQKKGFSIKEIPVDWKEATVSTFNFKNELKMIPYILKFFLSFYGYRKQTNSKRKIYTFR